MSPCADIFVQTPQHLLPIASGQTLTFLSGSLSPTRAYGPASVHHVTTVVSSTACGSLWHGVIQPLPAHLGSAHTRLPSYPTDHSHTRTYLGRLSLMDRFLVINNGLCNSVCFQLQLSFLCNREKTLKLGRSGFKPWPHHLPTVWTVGMTSVSFTTAVGRSGPAS